MSSKKTRSRAPLNITYEEQQRYIQIYGVLPSSLKEKRRMNEEIQEMDMREREERNNMIHNYETRGKYISAYGRIPRNAQERARWNAELEEADRNYNRNIQEQYARERREELEYIRTHPEEFKRPDPEQVWKLQMLHRKNPNLGNLSMVEELAMRTGHPSRLEKYLEKNMSNEETTKQFQEGGPVVEGVGRGPSTQKQVNKRVLTRNNARKLNLLKKYYGPFYDPETNYSFYSQYKNGNNSNDTGNGRNGAAVGGPRRRKTRKANRS